MHPSLLLYDFTDTLLMLTRQPHQPEYRKLLFVKKNRAQSTFLLFCSSMSADSLSFCKMFLQGKSKS